MTIAAAARIHTARLTERFVLTGALHTGASAICNLTHLPVSGHCMLAAHVSTSGNVLAALMHMLVMHPILMQRLEATLTAHSSCLVLCLLHCCTGSSSM